MPQQFQGQHVVMGQQLRQNAGVHAQDLARMGASDRRHLTATVENCGLAEDFSRQHDVSDDLPPRWLPTSFSALPDSSTNTSLQAPPWATTRAPQW